VPISNFGFNPRIKTRLDVCETHGEYDRTLVEAFTGDARVMTCPRCRFDAIHGEEGDTRDAAIEIDAWAKLNGKLFATGIAKRFRACTLDNYRTDNEGQKRVLDACQGYVDGFAESLETGRCLLLVGNFGNGKTHLGCAIVRAAVEQHKATALYVAVADLIALLKSCFNRDAEVTEKDVIAELTAVDLLLLDEIGATGNTEFERQTLHNIIDIRYRKMLPTIITSNLPPEELQDCIGERAMDRLRQNGGQAVAFDWESARRGEA
tara:strand:- start:8708 stop:9499 length:792 start_codon:yes stop_codon:yes gene_type:complete